MRLTKKISRSGAVTLPKTLRTEMGLPIGSAVDIETCGKQIVIKKHTPLCYFAEWWKIFSYSTEQKYVLSAQKVSSERQGKNNGQIRMHRQIEGDQGGNGKACRRKGSTGKRDHKKL